MTDIIELEMLGDKVKLLFRNNQVSKTSIQMAFLLENDEQISLLFLLEDQEVACGYDEPYFFLPDNWRTLKFIVKPFKPPHRLLVDIEEKRACENQKTDEKSTEDMKWFRDLQPFALYYKDSSNVTHCVTPVSKNLVATCAHEGNRNLTVEITEETPVIIRNCFDANYRVPAKVLFRNEFMQLVVLQTINTEFLQQGPFSGVPDVGMRYLMFEPWDFDIFSPTVGHCTKNLNACRIVGSNKYSSNNIGAGVWNSSRQLIGMNVMVENKECEPLCLFIPISIISSQANIAYYRNDPSMEKYITL